MRRRDIFGPEESDVPAGPPLKRLHTISRSSGDDVSPLPPRSPVSEEHTTAGSTSPRTTTDNVVSVDQDDLILVALCLAK